MPCAEYLLVYSSVFKISIDDIVNTTTYSEIMNATRDNTSKKRYNITLCMAYLTALIPAMIALIALIAHYILPELIPMHYNGQGEIDRWGNRLELFGSGYFHTLVNIAVIALIQFINIAKHTDKIPIFKIYKYKVATLMITIFLVHLISIATHLALTIIAGLNSNIPPLEMDE